MHRACSSAAVMRKQTQISQPTADPGLFIHYILHYIIIVQIKTNLTPVNILRSNLKRGVSHINLLPVYFKTKTCKKCIRSTLVASSRSCTSHPCGSDPVHPAPHRREITLRSEELGGNTLSSPPPCVLALSS